MSILRRIGPVLIALALVLPVTAAPVTAHVGAGWAIEWGVRPDGEDTVVAGLVTNHTTTRQTNIQVTATWRNGDTVVATETTTAFIDLLAQHSTSPFKLTETSNVTGATLSLSVAGSATLAAPSAQLVVDPGTLTVDTYTGTVHNNNEVLAEAVRVFAVRRQGGIIIDAAGSSPIATIAAFGSSPFTIVFDDFPGTAVGSFTAQSEAGDFHFVTWNNWFGDLGNSSFVDEIAWLADHKITFGCDVHEFCPKSPVTREQMAVFLDRALDLPTAIGKHPFTDIGTRPDNVRQAIHNLYEAGIAGGCTATTFCPLSPVTRGQMSKFIVLGYELAPIPGPGIFTDDNGHFSEPYNNRMAADGITGGCGTVTYCPHVNVLREQMAKFLFEAEN